MYNCEVTECEESGLRRQRWRFWLHDDAGDEPALILERWYQDERSSRKHQFCAVKTYHRLAPLRAINVPVADVPLSESVKKAALRQLLAVLAVKK